MGEPGAARAGHAGGGEGQGPPGAGSRDCRNGRGLAGDILDGGGCHIASERHHPGLGLNEPDWEHLGRSMGVTWETGGGHVPPRALFMTDEMEVASPVISWIAAGAVLPRGGTIPAWGLMSLIGSTWGNPGGSCGRRLRVTCPPQVGSPYRRTTSGSACAIFYSGGHHLYPGWHHPAWGLMSLTGSNCGVPGGYVGGGGGSCAPRGKDT